MPLSSDGRKEAELLASRLSTFSFNAIYCSNLQRARETAAAIAQPHNLEPIVLPYLREYYWGPLQGLTRDEIAKYYPCAEPGFKKGVMQSVVGGEPIRYLIGRVRLLYHFLMNKAQDNRDSNLIVVSHGRLLHYFLIYALGFSLKGPRPFVISPASLSILEKKSLSASFRLLLLNDTCHLECHTW